jgi:hypothetical protein
MAYIPEWERLPSVLTRVMDGGSSRRQAKTDICTALADGKIGVRPSLELVKQTIVHHEMAHRFAREIMKFVHDLREGINLYPEPWELHRPFCIPNDLQPQHLDWRNSRFKSHLAIQLRPDLAPALLWLVSIELASANVTEVLLKGGNHPPNSKGPVTRVALRKPKRGRPPEYAWAAVKARLAEYASIHGPIQTTEELLQKCADFASAFHSTRKTPSDKTIREAIRTHGLDRPALTDGNSREKSR